MNFETDEKYMPFSEQAEQSVLASLINGAAMPLASAIITREDFFDTLNGHIFSVIEKLDANKSAIDEMTVISSLEEHGEVDNREGLEYIMALAVSTANVHNIETYCKTVKDFSNERLILRTAGDMINAIKRGEGSSRERQNMAMASFNSIETEAHEQQLMGTQVKQFLVELEAKANITTEVTGMATGLEDLDKATGGFQDGDFVVIGARPGQGKTTLGVNAMVTTAKNLSKTNDGGLVMIFSMEMSATQLIGRMFASEGGVQMNSIKAPGVHMGKGFCAGYDGINAAGHKIKSSVIDNMIIDDRPALSPQQIRSACLSAERKHGKKVRAVLVDYVQIMTAPGEDTQRIATCSKALKALAMELKCPVVTLAQLNREVEKRSDKTPKSSDLKGSGQLEQDADIIILIHSDEESDDIDRGAGSDEGYAMLIIDKFRAGVCQDILVKKELSMSRFKTHVKGY